MPMQVILLEHVDNLGGLGDVVKVKPGYARNYLIPQSKALRATDDNIAYFEAQKKELEKQNDAKKKEAEKELKKIENITVSIIRLASESGHLYGSVSARDIAEAAAEKSGLPVTRAMIVLNDAFKMIGLFPVTIALHPEVRTEIRVNIARTEEEAKTQEKTGKALIADQMNEAEEKKAEAEAALEQSKKELMDEKALEADQQSEQEEAEKRAKEEAEAEAKAEKRAAKKAAAAEEAEAESTETEDDATEETGNENEAA